MAFDERKYKQQHYIRNRDIYLARADRYAKEHPDRVHEYKIRYSRANDKARNAKYKEKFISMYGGKCACCGETIKEFLCIDHINGQRGVAKREVGRNAWGKAIKEYRPDLYRVLCCNCNQATRYGTTCPHKRENKK